jgi:hypothetical protein
MGSILLLRGLRFAQNVGLGFGISALLSGVPRRNVYIHENDQGRVEEEKTAVVGRIVAACSSRTAALGRGCSAPSDRPREGWWDFLQDSIEKESSDFPWQRDRVES